MIKEGRKRETQKENNRKEECMDIIINTKKTIKINIVFPAINLTTFINAPQTSK